MTKHEAKGWVVMLPDGFGWQDDGTFRLPLFEPVKHGQEEVAELHFKRPTVKEMRRAPVKLEVHDDLFRFVAQLTAVPGAVLDQVGGEDMQRVLEVGFHFFNGSMQRIGVPE